MRKLNQDAGAVAHQRVRAGRAAMAQVFEDIQTPRDDIVALAILDIGHETDTARIVFIRRIVKSLPLW